MTLDELIETYGGTELYFRSYGRWYFTFKGEANNGDLVVFERYVESSDIGGWDVDVDTTYVLGDFIDGAREDSVDISVRDTHLGTRRLTVTYQGW